MNLDRVFGIFCFSMCATSFALAADVMGWNDAKFGMNLDAVKKTYPQSSKQFRYTDSKECWEKSGETDKPTQDDIDHWKKYGPSEYNCEYLELDTVLGSTEATAKFYFSARSNGLSSIEISTKKPPSIETYAAFKEGLQTRFGAGTEKTEDLRARVCEDLRRRVDSGDPVRGFELRLVAVYTTWSVGTADRYVKLQFRESGRCSIAGFPERLMNRIDGSTQLKLEFEDRAATRPVTPKF